MIVWIFQTGEPVHTDLGQPRPMRAMNLANALIDHGHRVTIWTSSFFHQEKRHRSHKYETHHVNNLLEIRLIPSRGYKKNIGIERLIDHAQLASNLWSALRREKSKPDAAFIGYPPIEFAFVAQNWLKKNSVPTTLDLKDQWPDIFIEPFPAFFQPLIRSILIPYLYISRKTLRNATAFCTMSQPYLKWMSRAAGRPLTDRDFFAPLTSPVNRYSDATLIDAKNWWKGIGVDLNQKQIISFVGNFMSVFDFELIYEAAVKLKKLKVPHLIILAGSGGTLEKEKARFLDCDNVIFPGWIDEPKINVLYNSSCCALIPYKNIDNYTLNTPNKVIDAMSYGVPIVTSLTGEVERLVAKYSIGFVCNENTSSSFCDAISFIIENPKKRSVMSDNCLALYRSEFSYEMLYSRIVKSTESLRK